MKPLTQHRCNGRRCAICQPVLLITTEHRLAYAAAIRLDPSITTVRTPAWRVPKPRREV